MQRAARLVLIAGLAAAVPSFTSATARADDVAADAGSLQAVVDGRRLRHRAWSYRRKGRVLRLRFSARRRARLVVLGRCRG